MRRKRGKSAHLGKVGRGSWKRKRGHRRHRGSQAIAHLRKVKRKCGKTALLRKVGRGSWKWKRGHRRYRGSRAIAHLRKVRRKCGKTALLRKVGQGFRQLLRKEWEGTEERYRRRRLCTLELCRERPRHSFGRSKEMAGKCDSFGRSGKG